MKKICNIIKNLIIFVYILLIIFVTICLLSYNDYKITVFGDTTLIPIIDENLEPDYTIGDLVIVEKGKLSKVKEGDEVFFYRTFAGEATINYAKIIGTERVSDTQYTYTVEGDYRFSSDYYIGNTDSVTIIPKFGGVLKVLQSKWGFLFLGVFPSLLAFLYTLYSIIAEVRYNDSEEDESKEKTTKNKEENKKGKNEVEEKKEKIEGETIEEKIEPEIADKKENEITETKKNEEKNGEEIENKEEKKELTETEANAEEVKIENEEKQEDEENKKKEITEEQKKALVEAKLKSMTEEQKKALIEAKLKSMTPEEKRALIEAKKKKMEEQKNK